MVRARDSYPGRTQEEVLSFIESLHGRQIASFRLPKLGDEYAYQTVGGTLRIGRATMDHPANQRLWFILEPRV